MSRTVVLVSNTTSYRAGAFLDAAAKLGCQVIVASDRCHVLDREWRWPPDHLVIDFYDPDSAARVIVEAARGRTPGAPVRAVVPAEGEAAALVAALAASALGLPANHPEAARAARDKRRMRELCATAGLATPRFLAVPAGEETGAAARRVDTQIGWPCVLKPVLLSASRGVMRADDPTAFIAALTRLRGLLSRPELAALDPVAGGEVLVESFVPGPEVALEGVLDDGALRTLALFDKPDPLDGPFFEETIYVTPSRLPLESQRAVAGVVAAAARALGLRTGPVHAELRLPPSGPVAIEVAARSIGGLCGRTLRFGSGWGLEELILRHALGEPVEGVERQAHAAGVMMIPIPGGGILRAVGGVEQARAVPGIEDVVISIRPGEMVVPLPEGGRYLGFIFSRTGLPAEAEAALRAAHDHLSFDIAPVLPAAW